jgi:hypothetical protein
MSTAPDPLVANLKAHRHELAESKILKSALWYAAHDWPVFPCRERGKEPLTEHGFKDATTDPEQIRAWWRRYPRANVAIAVPDGYAVLDIDGPNGWAALEGAGYTVSSTARQQTGRGPGHEHHLFRLPPGVRLSNGATALVNVEIKTEGGYILAAPSVHPSGAIYRWLTLPLEENIADAPEWLLTIAKPATGNGKSRPPGEWAELIRGPITEGGRRGELLRLGGLLFRRLPAEVAYELGCLWARSSCSPPIDPNEVDRILDDVAALELHRRGGAA